MFFQAVNCHFQLADHHISLLHINKQTLLFWPVPKAYMGKMGDKHGSHNQQMWSDEKLEKDKIRI